MTASSPGLSRRGFFGVGASTLLVLASATAWRWRSARAGAASPAATPIAYVDHEGWMVSVAEKQALRARPADAPDGPR